MPQYGTPFIPYIGYLIGLSILITYLALPTAGSVIVATLFHGAVNTFGLTNTAAAGGMRGRTNFLSYGLARSRSASSPSGGRPLFVASLQ